MLQHTRLSPKIATLLDASQRVGPIFTITLSHFGGQLIHFVKYLLWCTWGQCVWDTSLSAIRWCLIISFFKDSFNEREINRKLVYYKVNMATLTSFSPFHFHPSPGVLNLIPILCISMIPKLLSFSAATLFEVSFLLSFNYKPISHESMLGSRWHSVLPQMWSTFIVIILDSCTGNVSLLGNVT